MAKKSQCWKKLQIHKAFHKMFGIFYQDSCYLVPMEIVSTKTAILNGPFGRNLQRRRWPCQNNPWVIYLYPVLDRPLQQRQPSKKLPSSAPWFFKLTIRHLKYFSNICILEILIFRSHFSRWKNSCQGSMYPFGPLSGQTGSVFTMRVFELFQVNLNKHSYSGPIISIILLIYNN